MSKNDLPKLLKIKEAAKMLEVNPETLRRWDKSGDLVAIRFGKRKDRRYREEDIKKFIEKNSP
jgi:site-specific DNA-methyltransferase (adenine-specific)